jgi:hypothetical protein
MHKSTSAIAHGRLEAAHVIFRQLALATVVTESTPCLLGQ